MNIFLNGTTDHCERAVFYTNSLGLDTEDIFADILQNSLPAAHTIATITLPYLNDETCCFIAKIQSVLWYPKGIKGKRVPTPLGAFLKWEAVSRFVSTKRDGEIPPSVMCA